MPPKFSIVARWWPHRPHPAAWHTVDHYILLGPTGPKKVSYWATKVGSYCKSKKVRVTGIDDPLYPLVTEQEYNRRYLEQLSLIQQEKIMAILKGRVHASF